MRAVFLFIATSAIAVGMAAVGDNIAESACTLKNDGTIITCHKAISDTDIGDVDRSQITHVVFRGAILNWQIFGASFPNLLSIRCLQMQIACIGLPAETSTDCSCATVIDDETLVTPTDMPIITTPRSLTLPIGMGNETLTTERPVIVSTQVTNDAVTLKASMGSEKINRTSAGGIVKLRVEESENNSKQYTNSGRCHSAWLDELLGFVNGFTSVACFVKYMGGPGMTLVWSVTVVITLSSTTYVILAAVWKIGNQIWQVYSAWIAARRRNHRSDETEMVILTNQTINPAVGNTKASIVNELTDPVAGPSNHIMMHSTDSGNKLAFNSLEEANAYIATLHAANNSSSETSDDSDGNNTLVEMNPAAPRPLAVSSPLQSNEAIRADTPTSSALKKRRHRIHKSEMDVLNQMYPQDNGKKGKTRSRTRGLLEGARNPFASPIGAQATTFVGHAVMEPTHYKTIAD